MSDRETLAPSPAPTPLEHSALPDEAHLVHQVVEERLVDMHFQPIVDLREGKVFAYEALCRPRSHEFRSPGQLISAAVRAGRIGELGRLQRATAVKDCPNWPLFINIEPNEFDQGWLVRPDDPVFRHRWPIYLEITETAPIKYFEQCHSVLGELRKKGVLLAIDDLGAGYSNLQYIAELEPDIVKLDRELVQGVRHGTREFGLLQSITRLCHEMGAQVVAEGIETREEFEAVVRAGADYCQGYLLSRPANPPPEIASRDLQWMARGPTRIEERFHEQETDKESPVRGPGAAGKEDVGSSQKTIEELSRQLQGARRDLAESEERRKVLFSRLQALSSEVAEVAKARGASQRAESSAPTAGHPPGSRSARPEAPVGSPDGPTPQARGALAARLRRLPLAAAAPVFFLLGVLFVLSLRPVRGRQASSFGPASQRDTGAQSSPVMASEQVSGPITPPASSTGETPRVGLTTQIEERIAGWSRAWMEHRAEDYLAFYSRDFRPPGDLPREAWEEQRRERVGRPGVISVSVDSPVTALSGGESARVTFLQSYESGTYSDQVVKTLALVREDGEWKIAEERVETR